MEIHERWETLTEDEFIEFDRVENKRSQRRDLHAFLMLDELFPGSGRIISGAEHDEIWLNVNDDQANTLTDEQIIELSRCGVMYGECGLSMFA